MSTGYQLKTLPRQYSDKVDFALYLHREDGSGLMCTLLNGEHTPDEHVFIAENGELPRSFTLSANQARDLYNSLRLALGEAPTIAPSQDTKTPAPPTRPRAHIIHTAIVREVGRLTIAEPEPPHTRYEHAALITFANADDLRDFLRARTVDVQLFSEPKV